MEPVDASLLFVCGICSKTYENSEDLNTHMTAFHPLFSCCDKEFNEIELGNHFMTDHMGLPSKLEETLPSTSNEPFNVRIIDYSKILHDHDYCEKTASVLRRREIFKKSMEEKEKISKKRKRSPSPPEQIISRKPNRKICSVNIMKPLPLEKTDLRPPKTPSPSLSVISFENPPKKPKNEDQPSELLTCGLCDKEFESPKEFEKHLKGVHYGYKNYFCQICGEYFNERTKLKYHILNFHGSKRYNSFKKKYQTIAPNLDLVCDICHKSFPNAKAMQKHQKNNREKIFQCKHCERRFHRSSHLKLHLLKIHAIPNPPTCQVCDYVCCEQVDLEMHLAMVHVVPSDKQVKCKVQHHKKENTIQDYSSNQPIVPNQSQKLPSATTTRTNQLHNFNKCSSNRPKNYPMMNSYIPIKPKNYKIVEIQNNQKYASTQPNQPTMINGRTYGNFPSNQFMKMNHFQSTTTTSQPYYMVNEHTRVYPAQKNPDIEMEGIVGGKDEDIKIISSNQPTANGNRNFPSNHSIDKNDEKKSNEKSLLQNLQFICDVCDEVCDSKHSLNLHFVTTHGHQILQTFDCDICGLRFDSRDEIKKHFVQIHRLTLFECGFCSELYKSPDLFKNHLKSHIHMRNTVFSNG